MAVGGGEGECCLRLVTVAYKIKSVGDGVGRKGLAVPCRLGRPELRFVRVCRLVAVDVDLEVTLADGTHEVPHRHTLLASVIFLEAAVRVLRLYKILGCWDGRDLCVWEGKGRTSAFLFHRCMVS